MDDLNVDDITIEAPEINEAPVGQDESLGNQFLNGVDEADREIVSKYINDWDAGVTKKFQSIHEQYEPFKGLDANEVNQAMQIFRMAQVDPVAFHGYITETLTDMGMLENDVQSESAQEEISNLPEFEGVPEAFVSQFTEMQNSMKAMNEFIQSQQAQQEQQSQQQQLDNLLSELHNEHGDFDEDAVLGRILKGMDPTDAVKDHKSYIEKAINSRNKRPNPPVVGGSGQTHFDQVDSSKMNDKKERMKFVQSALSNLED